MSLHEYLTSNAIEQLDPPFYSLIMAAMRKADSTNILKLQEAFPDVWKELDRRYRTRGGILEEDGVEASSIENIKVDASGRISYIKDDEE